MSGSEVSANVILTSVIVTAMTKTFCQTSGQNHRALFCLCMCMSPRQILMTI